MSEKNPYILDPPTLHFELGCIRKPCSPVSIDLSPDYPTNFLQFAHWGDYELKPDFEKMYFTDHVVEGFPDAQIKHYLMLSYYTSAEMVEQKFQKILVLPGDQINIKISKNQA